MSNSSLVSELRRLLVEKPIVALRLDAAQDNSTRSSSIVFIARTPDGEEREVALSIGGFRAGNAIDVRIGGNLVGSVI